MKEWGKGEEEHVKGWKKGERRRRKRKRRRRRRRRVRNVIMS